MFLTGLVESVRVNHDFCHESYRMVMNGNSDGFNASGSPGLHAATPRRSHGVSSIVKQLMRGRIIVMRISHALPQISIARFDRGSNIKASPDPFSRPSPCLTSGEGAHSPFPVPLTRPPLISILPFHMRTGAALSKFNSCYDSHEHAHRKQPKDECRNTSTKPAYILRYRYARH